MWPKGKVSVVLEDAQSGNFQVSKCWFHFLFIFYLKGRVIEKGREERETNRIFYLLAYSPNGSNSQDRASLKSRDWSFFWVSPLSSRGPSTGPFSVTFTGAPEGNYIRSRVTITGVSAHMGWQCSKRRPSRLCHNAAPLILFLMDMMVTDWSPSYSSKTSSSVKSKVLSSLLELYDWIKHLRSNEKHIQNWNIRLLRTKKGLLSYCPLGTNRTTAISPKSSLYLNENLIWYFVQNSFLLLSQLSIVVYKYHYKFTTIKCEINFILGDY